MPSARAANVTAMRWRSTGGGGAPRSPRRGGAP